jgi:hypothetical protein
MRLRGSNFIEDWYVLDTEGTSAHAQPEGTRGEWIAILTDVREILVKRPTQYTVSRFDRVGFRVGSTPDQFEFYSPRNSNGSDDFVLVSADEIPAMFAVLYSNWSADDIVFESVDQKQISGSHD